MKGDASSPEPVERATVEPVTLANVVPPGENQRDEPLAAEFSRERAARFLDSAALDWQKSRQCFTCHTNFAYLLARPSISTDAPAHAEVRDFAEKLVTELPACGSLILTSYGRPGHLKRALAAGVRGFLPKTVSAQVLADVVRTVHRGGRYVDPELAADAISAGDSPLTPREADVLELAAGGAPVDEIAKRAALTPGTVRNYLSSAAAKLGAANRHEAVQLARSRGWI